MNKIKQQKTEMYTIRWNIEITQYLFYELIYEFVTLL